MTVFLIRKEVVARLSAVVTTATVEKKSLDENYHA